MIVRFLVFGGAEFRENQPPVCLQPGDVGPAVLVRFDGFETELMHVLECSVLYTIDYERHLIRLKEAWPER